MYSPAPVPPVNIGLYWTDEDVFMSLERMAKGSSIPENVTADINPYQHMPSNLPDGIWYFIRSEQKKDSEHGFWNARGEACEIFRNSAITGWRTTLEFYEGQAPNGQRTNWVMQEYQITHKVLRSTFNSKESGILCRVFRSSGPSPNQEMQHKSGGVEIAGKTHIHPKPSVVLGPGSTTGQGSMSQSQVRNRDDSIGPLTGAGGLPNIPVEDMLEIDYILRGDYLELDDLADRESRSSSSDNTSCVTISSDECFDSLALLKDLEDQINQEEQGKDDNFKFSVAASVRPNEVVVLPANSVLPAESLISSNGSRPTAEDADKKFRDKRVSGKAIKSQKADADKKFLDKRVSGKAIKSQKADTRNEGTSNSRKVAKPSRSDKAVPEGEKKAPVGRMKKLKKKYLCFMPF